MPAFQFPGLNLALATPFDAAGSIDHARLERNIESYLAAGVKSFVLSSGTGMHVYLSADESRKLVEHGAKIIKGRAKIIVQTSALMVDDVFERTGHAKGCGADGVMVLPPFFEGATEDDELVAFYAKVASAGLPVIGYNVPQAVGVAITPQLLNKLFEIPNFCSVKDSSGDLAQQANLIRTGHPVMNGADSLVPYALYAGCSGLIWGGANFAPRTCLAMVAAATAHKWEEARKLWDMLAPAMSLIWEGDYVKKVYAAAEIMGYGAGQPRRPLSVLSSHAEPALRMALQGLVQSEKSLS
ncbi:MAG: dihydrodipicolinate synthase family protein [Alphaproteobacteria bacterium]|nr:dihydrodipicolinate synthase family protein [Alphaproteobacteria bacterium]